MHLERVVDLEYSVEEGLKLLSEAKTSVPVTNIKKEREGKYGAPTLL